jgi:2-enoate reductase
MLENAGVAAIQIDTGCYEVWHNQIEPTYHQERVHQFWAAGKIKEVVKSIPVFTQGKVGDPQEAEAVFNEGLTDMVCVGRSFVADPQWANKVKNDQIEDIVPCICCMEGCIGRTDAQRTLSCALDPRCGIESIVSITAASVKKKVLVVGAGPGGIEAALTAAARGHDVELWERSSRIGGQLYPASAPAFKKEMERLIDYYKAQIYKNGRIRLRLCKTATAENILDARPDAVILATGGVPVIPTFPQSDAEHMHIATDVLQNKKRYSQRWVVIGAGFVGCETALHLDYIGKDVSLVEMCDDILPDFPKWFGHPENNRMMVREMLKTSSINVMLSTKLISIDGLNITFERSGRQETMIVDEVALALGYKSDYRLQDELSGMVEVITVGDANKPAKILDAIWQGFSATVCL